MRAAILLGFLVTVTSVRAEFPTLEGGPVGKPGGEALVMPYGEDGGPVEAVQEGISSPQHLRELPCKSLMIAVGILGTLASVSGLLLAGVQTVRLGNLKRRDEADLWDAVLSENSFGLAEVPTRPDALRRRAGPSPSVPQTQSILGS